MHIARKDTHNHYWTHDKLKSPFISILIVTLLFFCEIVNFNLINDQIYNIFI